MDTIMTVSVAEYKELIEFKIRTEIEAQSRALVEDLELQLQAKDKELEDARECTNYWYERAIKVEKEAAQLKIKLNELMPGDVCWDQSPSEIA